MPIVGSGRVEAGRVVFPDNTTGTGNTTSGSSTSTTQTYSRTVVSSVSGNTVGVGAGIYAGSSGTQNIILNFKSIIGSTGIRVVQDQDDITLIATGAVETFVDFVSLEDTPNTIVANAVLIGGANALTWTDAASVANTVLTYTDSGLVWQAPAPSGVIAVRATGDSAVQVTGSPITSNGTLAFSLSNTTVSAGTYTLPTITVDRQGRITNAASTAALQVNGDGKIVASTANGIVSLSLAATNVVVGTYVAPTLSVDQQGRVITIANTVATLTGAVTGSGLLSNIVTVLAPNGVSAGTYTKVSVDTTGRVTAGQALSASDITTALNFTPVDNAVLGVANGVATLDSTGRVPTNELPAAITGAVTYIGVWNANTNSPPLTSGVGTKGYYYKVSVAGTTTLDGHAVWNVEDTLIYNGSTWDRIPGQGSTVLSVAGRVGDVVLAVADVSGAAPLAAPAFTGNATSTTPGTGDSSTSIATTAFVKNQSYINAAYVSGQSFATTAYVSGLGYINAAYLTSQGYITNSSLSAYVLQSRLAAANGVATLDSGGKVPLSELPTSVANAVSSLTSTASTLSIGNVVNSVVNIELAGIANVAGLYTAPVLTIDAYGRITHAVTGTPGGVQSFTVTGSGITVTNGTVTNTGTVALSLSATGVAAGTYATPTLVIGADGRISNALSSNFGSVTNVATLAPNFANVYAGLSNGAAALYPIVGTPGRTVVSSGGSPAGIIIDLANGIATAGTYDTVTVDSYGRVTGGSTANATALAANAISSLLAGRTLYTFTGTGSQTVWPLSNAVGGTNDFMVAVAGSLLEPGIGYTVANSTLTLTSAVGNGTLFWAVGLGSTLAGNGTTNSSTVTLTGDVSGTGTGSVTTTLANSGVTAGTYSFATVTVDAKGRVTAIASGAAGASSGPSQYKFSVTFDSSGNIANSSSFTNVPGGWTITRTTQNQITVTHNLGKLPLYVTTDAFSPATSQWVHKVPSGNPFGSIFAIGINSSSSTPNTFDVYGVSATNLGWAAVSGVTANVNMLF